MATNEYLMVDFAHSTPVYTLDEVCGVCHLSVESVIEWVEFGVLNPQGSGTLEWRFPAQSILRSHRAARLQRDLELNLPGLALALDLLDDIDALHQQLEGLRAQLARVTGEL